MPKVILVRHPGPDDSLYLFGCDDLPTYEIIHPGDAIAADTVYGRVLAQAVTSPFEVSESDLPAFCAPYDAYLPLKQISGRWDFHPWLVLPSLTPQEAERHRAAFISEAMEGA